MTGSCINLPIFAAALVAPRSGLAAFHPPPPASARAAALPNCGYAGTPDMPIAYDPFAVFFDFGSARINPKAALVLKNAAEAYRPLAHCLLLLSAHTDSMEAASRKPDLSVRRADAVIRFLRGQGLTMRTKVEAYGDSRPLVNTPKGAAEPQNRFVMFNIAPPMDH